MPRIRQLYPLKDCSRYANAIPHIECMYIYIYIYIYIVTRKIYFYLKTGLYIRQGRLALDPLENKSSFRVFFSGIYELAYYVGD